MDIEEYTFFKKVNMNYYKRVKMMSEFTKTE